MRFLSFYCIKLFVTLNSHYYMEKLFARSTFCLFFSPFLNNIHFVADWMNSVWRKWVFSASKRFGLFQTQVSKGTCFYVSSEQQPFDSCFFRFEQGRSIFGVVCSDKQSCLQFCRFSGNLGPRTRFAILLQVLPGTWLPSGCLSCLAKIWGPHLGPIPLGLPGPHPD